MIESSRMAGFALLVAGGTLGGCWAVPSKWMRHYKLEQWLFIMALCGQLALPWAATFLLCPNATEALRSVSPAVLAKANGFSAVWGAANAMFGMCLARIGFSLTAGIMAGIGLPLGVLVPMVLKGSGKFADAPSPASSAGMIVLLAMAVMLAGFFLAALAGHEREKASIKPSAGNFATGLILAVGVGVFQIGLSFAFVYSQGPIMAALAGHGAGQAGATIGVWALTMPGGAIVNIIFAACLLSRKNGWRIMIESPRDLGLGFLIGLIFFVIIICMGMGMCLIGPLGASVGFGVLQAFQLISSQAAGVLLGEWKGAGARPQLRMKWAVALMLAAVLILSLARADSSP
ncbi:MAG: L-rhamnose/proton symporter RhaT [Verrucomicrobiae bacterium]|nr:L-rhamnose/proton symporter RhaT [Verrucomicrobiae bacterium]